MSHDFEARRRERLQRQRKQRERMRIIKLILSAVLFILVIIIIISAVSKCSGKKESEGTAVNNITATQEPVSASETPTGAVTSSSEIPAPKAGSNDLLTVLKNSGQKGHAYLTFENGPDETITPQILDILRRYNIKATFFMTGKEIEKNPQLCTRVMQEGHLAAVSSYTNVYSTIYSNEATFMNEVDKTYELITENAPAGIEPFRLFRFPGGSSYTKTDSFAEKMAEEGYYQCDWNSSNGDDVTGVTKTAENLLFYFNKYKPQLNNLVIQMHDSADKQATVDMLPQLIEQLIEEGWEFNRLDEIDFSNAESSTDEPAATDAADNTASRTSSAAPAATAPSSGITGSDSGTTGSSTSSGTTKSSTSGTGSTSSGTTKSSTSGTGSTSSGTTKSSTSGNGSSTGGTTSSSSTSSTNSSGTGSSGAGSSSNTASDSTASNTADGIQAE